LVVPLRAAHKQKVQGFVHDISDSGQTLFLEPVEALAANNRLRELAIAEQREIERILRDLTDATRPHLPALNQFVAFVAKVDAVQARAELAVLLKAQRPQFATKGRRLHLQQARHPLLALRVGLANTIPLNLTLDDQNRVLVISGPNAGGKSVALKTVGLLVLMLQCGMLLPVSEGSELPCVEQLFVDIGDDQNLQSDLSTYTSHLTHMQHFLGAANPQSLVLIDEMGTGTDPNFGGPIAEAILEALLETGTQGMVTTHYSNLKEFAQQHPHASNGAMEFNTQTLVPTYRLLQGTPGSSYALEVASRVGISAEVLARAEARMEAPRLSAEKLLLALERDKRSLQQELEFHQRQGAFLTELIEKNQARAQKDVQKQAQWLEQAEENLVRFREKAQRKVQEAQAEAQRLRQLLQKAEAEAQKLRTQLSELTAQGQLPATEPQPTPTGPTALPEGPLPVPAEELRQLLQEKFTELRTQRQKLLKQAAPADANAKPLKAGDNVRRQGSEAVGTLLSWDGNRARVGYGQVEMTVPLRELERVLQPPTQKPAFQVRTTRVLNAEEGSDFNLSLDLRGAYAHDALERLDRFVNEAVLKGYPYVQVLHGKGTGVLRELVRQYVKENPRTIRRWESQRDEQGGESITVLHL
jgi:DNA mismatch repair protein MutS2